MCCFLLQKAEKEKKISDQTFTKFEAGIFETVQAPAFPPLNHSVQYEMLKKMTNNNT